MIRRLPAAAAALLFAAGGPPDPAPFDAVLAVRARDGGFDYRGVDGPGPQAPRGLSREPRRRRAGGDDAGRSGRLSTINAYNARAIETLLENPGRKIADIRGAFRTAIEHRVGGADADARRDRGSPARRRRTRASTSRSSAPRGPARRSRPGPTAPTGLSEALDRQARAFVNDPSKNVLDRETGRDRALEDLRLEPEGVRAGRRDAQPLRVAVRLRSGDGALARRVDDGARVPRVRLVAEPAVTGAAVSRERLEHAVDPREPLPQPARRRSRSRTAAPARLPSCRPARPGPTAPVGSARRAPSRRSGGDRGRTRSRPRGAGSSRRRRAAGDPPLELRKLAAAGSPASARGSPRAARAPARSPRAGPRACPE